MPTISIADFITFEVSLDEILKGARILLGQTKDPEVRNALKKLFKEVRKADNVMIKEVLTPLFKIKTEKDLANRFDAVHQKFRALRLQHIGWVSEIQCHEVTAELNRVKASRAWRKWVPGLRRAAIRMELSVDNWIANDGKLYTADQTMMNEIDQLLAQVAQTATTKPKTALKELRDGLADVEDSFLRARKHLAGLAKLDATV
jgi:hypothetical protein